MNQARTWFVLTTVKALIKAPLNNNYDPQRRLIRSEKKLLLQTLRGALFREAPSN